MYNKQIFRTRPRMVNLVTQSSLKASAPSSTHHTRTIPLPYTIHTFCWSLACGIRFIDQKGSTACPKQTNQGAAEVHRSERGEFTFFVKLKTHTGGPFLLWYWREGQISNDLVRNTWTTPENQPDFSSSCIRIEIVLAWEKKIQSTTRNHETFEYMSSLRFGGSYSYKKRVFFQCISPFGFGGLILIQKKYRRNCHPHFLLNCCVAFAKLFISTEDSPEHSIPS